MKRVFAMIGRALPVASGLGMYSEFGPCKWAMEGVTGLMHARLRDHQTLLVNPHEYLGRTVYLTGEWDPKVTWICNRLLRLGDTFVDVGAHCGIVALQAARLVGPTGAVHAFEPQPLLAHMLRSSANMNGWGSSLHVHEFGLSDQDGTATLHLPRNKQILASLIRDDGDGSQITIQTRHAEEYLRRFGKIRLLKMDIEGYEHVVLKAMGSLLTDGTVEHILFESIPKEGPFWERPAVRLLKEAGYTFQALPKSLFRCKLVPVEQAPAAHDFLASRGTG